MSKSGIGTPRIAFGTSERHLQLDELIALYAEREDEVERLTGEIDVERRRSEQQQRVLRETFQGELDAMRKLYEQRVQDVESLRRDMDAKDAELAATRTVLHRREQSLLFELCAKNDQLIEARSLIARLVRDHAGRIEFGSEYRPVS